MDTKLVVDCSTGITTEIELTAEEIAQREADALAFEAEQAQKELDEAAKAEAKAGLLARLGLTDDEFKTLIS
jgi:hypothetical protein